MRGILVYDKDGKRRNEWFIDRLIASAEALGHELSLFVYDGDELPEKDVDFAIVRTISPSLNEYFERFGIPTFNNAKTSRIANDKWQTYLFAKGLGISVMDTAKPASVTEATDRFAFPFVLKSVSGHGGSEVFLVDNAEKCKEIFSLLENTDLIAQELCSEVGVDMRVYLLGGEVLAAAKRTSDTDFRSNFSLGGKAQIVPVPEQIEKTLARVHAELECDLVGVDFIRHGGKWVLNEIEDVVGTRMLYSLTDLDPARLYIEHIISKIG